MSKRFRRVELTTTMSRKCNIKRRGGGAFKTKLLEKAGGDAGIGGKDRKGPTLWGGKKEGPQAGHLIKGPQGASGKKKDSREKRAFCL